MRTLSIALLTVLALGTLAQPAQAQVDSDPAVGKLKGVRLTGLPGALRGRLQVQSPTWPEVAALQFETPELDKLGVITTQAQDTLDQPDEGFHSFVKVFSGSTGATPTAQKYQVKVFVYADAGKSPETLLGTTTVTVDPASPPPVVAMVYGPSKEIKAKLKIEVVAQAKRTRVILSAADASYGLAQGVNVEVVGFDGNGKPVVPGAPFDLAHVRSVVRFEASAKEGNPMLANCGFWQDTRLVVWGSDASGDGELDTFGEALLELDIRDVAIGKGDFYGDAEGGVGADLTLRATQPEFFAGGLEVYLDTLDGVPLGQFWLPFEALRPEFLVALPFTSDPAGQQVDLVVQFYNKEGKEAGPVEGCSLLVGEKASCKTASGTLLAVGGWGGGSWAGSGSTEVKSTLQLRLLAPLQAGFEPAAWPYKVGVSATIKSTTIKPAAPAYLLGQRTTAFTSPEIQPGVLKAGTDEPGPLAIQLRLPKSPVTPGAVAELRGAGWGEVLIDGPKFEVE